MAIGAFVYEDRRKVPLGAEHGGARDLFGRLAAFERTSGAAADG